MVVASLTFLGGDNIEMSSKMRSSAPLQLYAGEIDNVK